MRLIACLILIFSLSGTAFSADENPPTEHAESKAVHKGSILSSFVEDGYTYIQYTENNKVSWVAVLETAVNVNDRIEFPDSQPVYNYHPRSLNQNIEQIIFASEIKITETEKPATSNSEQAKPELASAVSPDTESQPAPRAEETPQVEKPQKEVKPDNLHRGKVLSSLKTRGYSYIEFEEDGEVSWVAVTETPVAAGDIIEFPKTQMLTNFGSKSIQKTFERLYMVSAVRIVSAEEASNSSN